MATLAERQTGAPSLKRAAAGFLGSTFVMASLMVFLSAVSS
jgi:hypothetical protein